MAINPRDYKKATRRGLKWQIKARGIPIPLLSRPEFKPPKPITKLRYIYLFRSGNPLFTQLEARAAERAMRQRKRINFGHRMCKARLRLY